jgi:hypothetical protein
MAIVKSHQYIMKTYFSKDSNPSSTIYYCVPETAFEQEVFGCCFVAVVKKLEEFIFWWENPDLSHLDQHEEPLEAHNPNECVELPGEFLHELKKALESSDGVGELYLNALGQWEEVE